MKPSKFKLTLRSFLEGYCEGFFDDELGSYMVPNHYGIDELMRLYESSQEDDGRELWENSYTGN